MIVYCIENKVNGKKYVGVTKHSIETRWNQHVSCATTRSSKKSAIHNAISKYGVDQFVVTLIDEADSHEDLMSKEKFWISSLDTKRRGYNCTAGGEYSPRSADMDVRERMRQSHLGVPLSEETKRKMSATRKGRPQSDQHVRARAAAHTGHRHSEEFKIRMSQIKTGSRHTEESKRKIAASMRKVRSDAKTNKFRYIIKGRKRVLRDDGSFYYVYPTKESNAD